MNFLQQSHTSQAFANCATNWGSSFQNPEPMRDISFRSPHLLMDSGKLESVTTLHWWENLGGSWQIQLQSANGEAEFWQLAHCSVCLLTTVKGPSRNCFPLLHTDGMTPGQMASWLLHHLSQTLLPLYRVPWPSSLRWTRWYFLHGIGN